MLRDVLTASPGFVTWPCDEIPYVWRHGNRAHPDDEFTREMARPAVRAFIRREFDHLGGRGGARVVEKTCANALRVRFVDEVLPDARFLVIVRHGMDAAASAMLRWRSGFDLRYSLAKARWVPAGDLPYYAGRYLLNRLRRLSAGDRRLAVWGPVFAGMRDLPRDLPLAELSARQWRRCVERTDEDLAAIDPRRVHVVRYEDFVAAPAAELARILAFLGADADPRAVATACAGVRGGSVGKALHSLPAADKAIIARVCSPLLARHGYTMPGTDT
ncbi:MAG: sulfotransferase [Krumholzibacteria bacterium]|nr:sulfotransferase [Candidatus Krumholzibacteria bacterium]